MAVAEHAIDVGEAEFEREVLERSKHQPVVVDFWAPWCAPCRTLGPLLEQLAAEHAGAFRLAKVNVDESPHLARAFDVRSIPTVVGLREGAIVAEFLGLQPESAIRAFLARLLPSDADRLAQEGEHLGAAGHRNAAEERFRAALAQDASHAAALLGLARLAADDGRVEEAQALLGRVPASSPRIGDAERLAAALRVRAAGGGAGEAALRARLAEAPGDAAARLALGRLLAASGDFEAALAELLESVRRDARFEDAAARKAMLDVFATLGPEHPLTARFRSELARALFR